MIWVQVYSCIKIFSFYLLKALLITIISEELFLFIQKEKDKKLYFVCLITNIVTNLSLNMILQSASGNYYLWLVILEVVVVLVESLIYYLFTKRIGKSIRISLVCNLASFLIGTLV